MNLKPLLFGLTCPFFLVSNNIFIQDAKYFYSQKTAAIMLETLLPCAIAANTSLDKNIYLFYQDNLKCNQTNSLSTVAKAFGSNKPLSIAFFSGIFSSYFFDKTPFSTFLYQLSFSSLRAVTVGMPTLICMQNILGADRPWQNTDSYYHPFNNDHGVSGHAFMGSIPFITAAMIAKEPAVRLFLYTMSFLTPLSRLNDSAHYPSQIILGWTLGYCSCLAIQKSSSSVNFYHNKLQFSRNF